MGGVRWRLRFCPCRGEPRWYMQLPASNDFHASITAKYETSRQAIEAAATMQRYRETDWTKDGRNVVRAGAGSVAVQRDCR